MRTLFVLGLLLSWSSVNAKEYICEVSMFVVNKTISNQYPCGAFNFSQTNNFDLNSKYFHTCSGELANLSISHDSGLGIKNFWGINLSLLEDGLENHWETRKPIDNGKASFEEYTYPENFLVSFLRSEAKGSKTYYAYCNLKK